LVLGQEIYKIASGTITQTLGKIVDIHVIVGKVVCQMIFLVVDIDSYDLLLRLDFLMKIETIINVEKGIMYVWNGPNVVVPVLAFNVQYVLKDCKAIRSRKCQDEKRF
jgi:hypothetical protein